MSGDTPATGTQAEPEATPQAGTTDTPDTPRAGEPDSISLDEAKKLRSEAKSLRTRLKAFEDAEEARKTAEMSEAEKVAARARQLDERESTLTARERDSALRDAITEAMGAEGFGYTLKAPLGDLLRLVGDAVEWDGGEPTHVQALVNDLTKSRAYLFEPKSRRPGPADIGHPPTNGAEPKTPTERLALAYGQRASPRR